MSRLATRKSLLTLNEASQWASEHLNKNVTNSNISYLIQYGLITKFYEEGKLCIDQEELKQYYEVLGNREKNWKQRLGNDLNWHLSFEKLKEAETTKHVHRLHPYKGKFIPQLVEYFIDDKTDDFKQEVIFNAGDIILDPFCGSGTTLVQANETGIHAIGVDISSFNSFISNSKIEKYDFIEIENEANKITFQFKKYANGPIKQFESEFYQELSRFNNEFFPSPEFKLWVKNRQIDEKSYIEEKEAIILKVYNELLEKYSVKLTNDNDQSSFLDKWYIHSVRKEIDLLAKLIKKITNQSARNILKLILSRTIRSCRATTHADLATLKNPQLTPYYCKKHGRICKPLFSLENWWSRYIKDTSIRLKQFDKLRTNTHQVCLTGDSQNINLIDQLEEKTPSLAEKVRARKIKGIFSSPPYVGLIDYHEQHAYAYELFGLKRKDDLEIGSLFKGQRQEARESYVKGISQVLVNMKQYLVNDYDILLVANDKYDLYPKIAERSGMQIVKQYKRPVLNRTEKDKGAYCEIIFHLKGKN